MATIRRFLFQQYASGQSFLDSSGDSDGLSVGQITVVNDGSNVGLLLGNTEIQNVRKVTMAASSGGIDLNTSDILNGRDASFRKITLSTGVDSVTLDAGGQRITGLGTPNQSSDAVPKSYVDSMSQGVDWKSSVRAATTGAISVSSPSSNIIDGVVLNNTDRVLVKDQTQPVENGIYTFHGVGTPMARAADAVQGQLTSGAAVFVTAGTQQANQGYLLSTPDPINLGTTALTWTQFTSLGQVTAGAGLKSNGNEIYIETGPGIIVGADNLSVGILDGLMLDVGTQKIKLNIGSGLSFDASNPKKVQVALAASSGLSLPGGLLAVGAGTGITVGASTISVSLTSGMGISASGATVTAVANTSKSAIVEAGGIGVTVDPSNPTLEHNGTSGLRVKIHDITLARDAAGLKVAGLPGAFQIAGVNVGASVSATNLNTVCGGGDATGLHTHAGLTAVAYQVSFTAGSSILKGDPLYIAATGKVLKANPSADATSLVIGVAAGDAALDAQVPVMRGGIVSSVGSGWTPGTPVYLSSAGTLTQDPVGGITSRHRTIMVGVAQNASNLFVDVRDFGKKP